MEEKNIEQLFKDAFSSYEAPVDNALWQKIENSIQPSAVNPVNEVISSAGNKALVVKTASMIAGVALITAGILHYTNRTQENVPMPAATAPQEVVAPAIQPSSEAQTQNTETEHQKVKTEKPRHAKKETKAEPKVQPVTPIVKTEVPTVSNISSSHKENVTAAPAADNSNVKSEPVKKAVSAEAPVTENKTPEPVKQNNIAKSETATIPGLGNTIFTPNGDGIGDVFDFDDSYLSEVNVKIYNSKNYKLVYEWNQPGGNWNGKMKNGNEAEEGIYIVMINGKGFDGKIYKTTIKLQLRRN